MTHQLTTSYVKDAVDLFTYYKRLGERAIAQCPDEGLFVALDPESNSIAIIVKHMAGNMRSRWTDFLTSDGEKPDRNRDTEFEDAPQTRADVLALWERGWKYVLDTLGELTEAHLTHTVYIRNEPHSVMQAINRQVAHYSYHVGQIVFLAKHFAAMQPGGWIALTVPRGKSQQFTADVAAGSQKPALIHTTERQLLNTRLRKTVPCASFDRTENRFSFIQRAGVDRARFHRTKPPPFPGTRLRHRRHVRARRQTYRRGRA